MIEWGDVVFAKPGPVKRRLLRDYARQMRDKTIDAYGAKCACCGFDDRRFLSVDHIHNDGADHRKSLNANGTSIHEYLFDNGYPKDRFQLLCYNCNCAKQYNLERKGVCPHQLDREEIAMVQRENFGQ